MGSEHNDASTFFSLATMSLRRIAQSLSTATRHAAPYPGNPRGAALRAYTVPAGMDQGEQTIYKKLSDSFPGKRLEVQDVSGERDGYFNSGALPQAANVDRGMRLILCHPDIVFQIQRAEHNQAAQARQPVSEGGHPGHTWLAGEFIALSPLPTCAHRCRNMLAMSSPRGHELTGAS